MIKIAQGHLTLLGPKLSLGGIYAGPYYYYFFVPILILSGFNVFSIVYLNAFLFALSLGFMLYILRDHYDLKRALLLTTSVGLLPMFIFGSHYPGNGLSYLPLLLIYLLLTYVKNIQTPKQLLVIGLFSGILITTHPTNLLVIAPLLITFHQVKKKTNLMYLLGGIIIPFAPLVLFELRHGFIMFRDTFINSSYQAFLDNNIIPNAPRGKENVIDNSLFLASKMSSLILLSPFIYLLIQLISAVKDRPPRLTKDQLFLFSGTISFILLSIINRFKFEIHFLYPVSLFIFLITVLVIAKSKFWPLLLILISLEFYQFPKYLYLPSSRSPERIERAVNFAIDHQLVSADSSFNVIQATNQQALVPVGSEYRFFVRKRGFIPDSEYQYNQSKKLLIFSEIPDLDIAAFNNWATDQFGKRSVQNVTTYYYTSTVIYKFEK
jgi:hypothetical protein